MRLLCNLLLSSPIVAKGSRDFDSPSALGGLLPVAPPPLVEGPSLLPPEPGGGGGGGGGGEMTSGLSNTHFFHHLQYGKMQVERAKPLHNRRWTERQVHVTTTHVH